MPGDFLCSALEWIAYESDEETLAKGFKLKFFMTCSSEDETQNYKATNLQCQPQR